MASTRPAKKPSKRPSTKKRPAKKSATKKTATKKPAPKKTATKKSTTKKSATKKPAPKKRAAKKTAAPKRSAAKKRAVPSSPPRGGTEPGSLGWEAIDEACARVHGNVEPLHVAPTLPMMAGGDDPLEGISIFAVDRGTPHWHFVTYGFSELHDKDSDDPALSGFGFELTFRLARKDAPQPPAWACNALQNLARYVFRTGNPFGVGHHVPKAPIDLGHDREIDSVAFALDPELGSIDTPYGTVEFLQMVGITRDEAEVITRWSANGVLELLAERDPLLVTSLDRKSLLAEPSTRRTIEERIAKEGSSSSAAFTSQLAIAQRDSDVELSVGAIAVDDFRTLLEGRIPYGREFSLIGRGVIARFRPGDTPAWSVEPGELVVDVSPDLREELSAKLRAQRGVVRLDHLPSLRIEVLATDVRDQHGTLTETIG